MIFSSRRKRGPDDNLSLKIRVFFVGALLALVGIGLDSSVLVGLAIVILVAGILFRFLPGVDGEGGGGEEEPADEPQRGTSHEDLDHVSPHPGGPPIQS